MGFGPIAPDPNEPLFHADWERRVLGVTLCAAALGHWSIDESRHARESLPHAIYYAASYYEIWSRALTTLLLRHGEVHADELEAQRALHQPKRPERRLEAGRVPAVLAKGGPTDREPVSKPRFVVGDRVRTRNIHREGHCRLPAYARDKVGRIEALNGTHVFPDTNAHGFGERPTPLYTVAFDARTLWGEDAEDGLTVSIDAFEPYLDAA